MPRRSAVAVDNNFKGGLNTEATGLNFPENACTETLNCTHDEKGRSKRRLGFDYETGYSTATVNREDSVVGGFTWNNVAGDGSISLRVKQVGSYLYFYNITSSGAISANRLSTTVNLATFLPAASSGDSPQYNECQYASGAGYLIVVHPILEPFYCSYDPETQVITATQIDLRIRDLEGVDDSLDVNERPTATVGSMTATHKYNLFNQGWYFNSNAALTAWDTARTDLPSNSDVWWLFKNTSNAFDTTTIANVDTGNAPAPKGHYTLNVFEQDRSTESGIGGLSVVSTDGARCSTVAFMQGRAFYAGVNSAGFSSKIYVTPIIESASQFGKCYQLNDPTSEELSDLLPSDGGVISIIGIESVVKLFPLINMLLVFATNGIWAITGSQGIGYKANDYTVTKISSISAINAGSFCDVNGFPIWWNLEGIYQLTPAQASDLQFQVTSMTDQVIRSHFLDIPLEGRTQAKGAYNPLTKCAHWLYQSTEPQGPEEGSIYDSVLVHNFLTGGFYTWTINTGNVNVHDIFVVRGEGGVQSLESVTFDTGGYELMDETGDVVTTFAIARFLIAPKFVYTVSSGTNIASEFTFAEVVNPTYKDWYTYDGVGQDYESTFTVGYKLHSETQRYFQANYVFVFLEQEEGAACTMRGLWEFTTSADTHRWSAPQQIYNPTLTDRAVNFRRLKVRGKGRALQLQFTSESGAPFTIIGWSIFETQNAGL